MVENIGRLTKMKKIVKKKTKKTCPRFLLWYNGFGIKFEYRKEIWKEQMKNGKHE